jgi:hypothetical protein
VEPLKPDCISALQRKRLESWPEKLRARLSLVRFESKNCGIAAIPSYFQSNPGRFLCTSGLLVEREEFELSIPFLEPARARTWELHPFLQQQHTVGEWAEEWNGWD